MVNKSLLENITAMVIYGTISLVVKNIAVSSGEIAFWRVAIALAALLVYKLVKHEKLPFKEAKGDLFRLTLSGIAMGFDWILFFEALKYASVSVTTLSYYFCPVLLMILSPIVFKERLTLQKVVCFIMATAGLALLVGARSGGGNKELLGIALALAAACAYAFIIIIAKSIKSVDGIDKTIFQFFAAIIVLAIYVPLTSGFHAAKLEMDGIILLAVLGLVHTAFAYCLYFTSIGNLPGQKVALLGYIDPLIAVIVSVVFLQETISLWQLAGGVMIIGFTILNELGEAKRAKTLLQNEQV